MPTATDSELAHIVEPLRRFAVPIGTLREMPGNPRAHNARNLAYIGESVGRFRQLRPLVLAADGQTVIAGNGTLAAMKAKGWAYVAAITSKLEGEEARAFSIVDNHATDLSEFDDAQLRRIKDSIDDSLAVFLDIDSAIADTAAPVNRAEAIAAAPHREGFPDAVVQIGQYRFTVPHAVFQPWWEEITQRLGAENKDAINGELRQRLGV